MKPLVSVIVPVYNVEAYLSRCIESILSQTYANLEVILVDDGSPDNCGRICDEYARKDGRVRVIHQKNGGVSFARNTGLDVSTGEYIIFVDSDDFLSDDAVQALYDRLILDDSDMAIGKHMDISADGSTDDTFCRGMKDAVISGRNLLGSIGLPNSVGVSACAKLYKREILKDITFPALKCGEDMCYFLQTLEKCNLVSLVDKIVYFYFQRVDSAMHEKSENVKQDEVVATLLVVQRLLEHGFTDAARRWYARGLSRAINFKNKHTAVELFYQQFNRGQRRDLLKGAGIKTYGKWISLHIPMVNTVVQLIKRTVKRG